MITSGAQTGPWSDFIADLDEAIRQKNVVRGARKEREDVAQKNSSV